MRLRIGCVPYLNAKPLIDWFHCAENDSDAMVTYEPPSVLARKLQERALDVALVSTFELFQNPELRLLPGISISADGPVKSVRLFSKVPFQQIRSVALDTSSLTSTALIRILLAERYGVHARYVAHPPHLNAMLETHDAGLIIGDLRLFEAPAEYVLDLGEAWKALTGMPFVYAAWLALPGMEERAIDPLRAAKAWGCARLAELSQEWSYRLSLPLDRVEDYFYNVMQYDLDSEKLAALDRFHRYCEQYDLLRK